MDGDASEPRAGPVMLHFAYGANMNCAVMRRHAPEARAAGLAELADHRFLITADGYASVVPARAQVVHGVLWRLTPRDRVTLDAWENVDGGLYRAEMLAIRSAGRRVPALVYVARPGGEGRPRSGYIELVIAAARELDFPADYLSSLERWLPARPLGAGNRKIGEFR
jgi:AIG2-like family